VTRFNRKLLIGIAGFVCIVIFAATVIALQPIRLSGEGQGEELINTDRKAKAEGLDTLPRSYGDIKPPELGPPLPGDIGPPVVKMETELGVDQSAEGASTESDSERAERLRLAQQAQKAREATVFFQIAAARNEAFKSDPAASTTNAPAPMSPAASPNNPESNGGSGQTRKIEFLNAAGSPSVFNPHPLEMPVSPDQVLAGTAIAASLVTAINSDLPGFVIAQVTESVFDTVTGLRLLIPQGTKLIGKYDSVVSYGQRRALLVWNRMILPNGSSIVLDNLPATDAAGYAGLEDDVDLHTWQLIKGAALSTLLSVGSETGASTSASRDALSAAREAVQQNAARIGQQVTERNLDVQPTITVRAGWPLRVIVHKDLILTEYKP
jgi:type IV secretion system protein VirB10